MFSDIFTGSKYWRETHLLDPLPGRGGGVVRQLWVCTADLLAPSHDDNNNNDKNDNDNVMGYYLNRHVRRPSSRSLPRRQRGEGG